MKNLFYKTILGVFFIFNFVFGEMKIVSSTLSGDEILLGMGMKNSMVGVSGKVVDNEQFSNIVGEVNGIPRVENNLEIILSLNPDLVIVADWVSKDYVKHLESMGIELFKYPTPNNFSELYTNISNLSEKIGEREKGNKLISQIDERVKKIEEKAKGVKKRKRVLYYSTYGGTMGKDSFFEEMARVGNFINVASEKGIEGRANISKEIIIELNPEIIIVPFSTEETEQETIDFVLKDRSLSEVEAVKKGQVYSVREKHIIASSQYVVNSLETIFEKVYPEL